MTHGSPDWVRIVQVAVTVSGAPIIPDPTEETAVDGYGYVSMSSGSYQTLKTWTVTTGKVGILHQIELATTNYSVTQWRVTIGSVTVLEDETIPSAMSKLFADLRIAAGDSVTVEAKSDGSTTIEAWCDIDCKEVG